MLFLSVMLMYTACRMNVSQAVQLEIWSRLSNMLMFTWVPIYVDDQVLPSLVEVHHTLIHTKGKQGNCKYILKFLT